MHWAWGEDDGTVVTTLLAGSYGQNRQQLVSSSHLLFLGVRLNKLRGGHDEARCL